MYQRKNKDGNDEGEVISITYEDIDAIPNRVFKVKSLTSLNLSHNKLSSIPQEINQLKKLQNLTINHNLLSQISSLSKLSNLHNLSLAGNLLTEKEIDSCGLSNLHLQSLNLAKNQLTSIPKSVYSVKTLTKLVVSDNNISEIPDQLSNLVNLKFLGLNNNNFKEIPKCILGLPCLKGISISGNPFEDEVDVIYSLRNCAQLINSKVDSNAINAKIQLIQQASHNTIIDRSNTDISDISKHVSKAIFNLPEIIPVNHRMSQTSSFNSSPSATSINSHSQEDSEFFKRFRQLDEESIMNGINTGFNNYNFSHDSLNSETQSENKIIIPSKNSSVMSIPRLTSPLVVQDESIYKLDDSVNNNSSNNNLDEFSNNKIGNSSEADLENGASRKSSIDDDQAYMIKTPTSHHATTDINEINLENIIIKEESSNLSNYTNKNISKRKTQVMSMGDFVSKRRNSNVRQSLINPKMENTTNNVLKCSGCNEEIGSSDYIEALNGVWHTYCFKCKKCGVVLENTFYEVDNEPYCEQHYEEDDSLYCAECNELIADIYIEFDGKYYHEDHFVCSKCKTPLSGKQCYIMELNDENGNTTRNVYCEACTPDEENENENENKNENEN